MREIKFRIWDDKLKVLYTPEKEEEIKDLWALPEMKGGVLKVKPEIKVMQFTGLQDKNGIDIYEGDILDTTDGVETVVYEDACYYVSSLLHACPLYTYASADYAYNNPECTIIGNIYQNPELLNEQT